MSAIRTVCARTSITALLVSGLAAPTGVAGPTLSCLPDADGDGHPLFGNPETMLNPFAPLMGLSLLRPTDGAIGDLNADGHLDAAATFSWSEWSLTPGAQVSVLL